MALCAGMRKLVITDTLFSMDGDFADLRGLAALRRKHGFLLAVDDAHGTLVCGDRCAQRAVCIASSSKYCSTSPSLPLWCMPFDAARHRVHPTAHPAAAPRAAAPAQQRCWGWRRTWTSTSAP